MSAIEMVPVGKLKLADDNVRSDVGDVGELAASIKGVGLLEPLVCREGDYLVVCGMRRLAAAKKAGLKEVPVTLRAFTEPERIQAMVVENLQREDLTPLEEAGAYKRLVELGMTQTAIAKTVGCSQGNVAKRLALLSLPEPVIEAVQAGDVTLHDAQELSKLKDDPKLIEKIAKKGSSHHAISSKVERELSKKDRATKVAAEAAKLSKAGENVVRLSDDGYGYSIKAPRGMKLVLARLGWNDDGRAVEMDPAAHAKLSCHAVGVHPSDLSTVEICTDPAQHPDPKAKKQAAQDKAEKVEAEKRELIEKVTSRRREFVRGVVGAPAKTGSSASVSVVMELCYLALSSRADRMPFGTQRTPFADLVLELLGIELPEANRQYGAGTYDGAHDDCTIDSPHAHDRPKLVDEFELVLEEAGRNRQRVTLAMAAAELERMLEFRQGWYNAEPYFDVLKSLGYELHEAEKATLEQSKQ